MRVSKGSVLVGQGSERVGQGEEVCELEKEV